MEKDADQDSIPETTLVAKAVGSYSFDLDFLEYPVDADTAPLEEPVEVDTAPLEEAPVDVDILEEPVEVDTAHLEEAHGRLETLATLFEYYENNPAPAPP